MDVVVGIELWGGGGVVIWQQLIDILIDFKLNLSES